MTRKKKITGKSKLAQLFQGATDQRTLRIMGLFLVFFGSYLFSAFFSYLFTWKQDQSFVLEHGWSLLINGAVGIGNHCGNLGAMLSHSMIHNGFGLSSFLLAVYFSWIGARMLLPKRVKAPGRFIRHSLVLGFFAMVFLSFVFSFSAFPFGGFIGWSIHTWLVAVVGWLGTLTLLLASVGGLVVWYFNPSFAMPSFGQAKNSKAAPVNVPEQAEEEGSLIIPQKQYLDLSEVEEEFGKPAEVYLEDEIELDVEEGSLVVSEQGEMEELLIPLDVIEGGEREGELLAVEEGDEEVMDIYDPTLELSSFQSPSLELLENHSDSNVGVERAELDANKDQIISTLRNYKIEITKIKATVGPTVTLYEIVPAAGVRISKIKNLEDDIALSLSALGIRIIAPIPGKGTIGIEVPNKNKQVVGLKELLVSEKYQQAKMDLPIALGKTISNEVFVADLAKMPHMMIAGATGQGKSVGINTILMSILYKKHPSQVKLVLIDPKKVELFPYSKLEKHFLAMLPDQDEPIITETKKVIHTLNSLCIEMDQRYDLLKMAHARNIKEYNKKIEDRRLNPLKGHKFLPFIVLVVDEFADLIMTAGKEVELPIARLAQLARAVGIHLIIATQRPSVNIITGVIKANFPARIAFKVTSKIDSRTILDAGGADQLIGRGDMLLSVGGDMVRLQCAFVDTPEVEDVLSFIGDQRGYPEPYMLPEYIDPDDNAGGMDTIRAEDLDEFFEEAARLVVANQHGSTSMIQRKMKLGYNRAGRIMDQLEAFGIVGQNEGSKAREVMIQSEMELEEHLGMIRKA
jgi:DNA segregation ATPase FtsK/SpoIIIE, S-DNA-T family